MTPQETALAGLAELLYTFSSGRDQSSGLVREIDDALTCDFPSGDGFPDSEAFAELEVATACFRPGGGQFMYDEEQMAVVCRYVLARMGKTIV